MDRSSELPVVSTADDPALESYGRQYLAARPQNERERRLELLRKLRQLPKGGTEGVPKIISRTDRPRHHGDGGVYTRFYDQYGDQYGVSIDGVSTIPELSRLFNIPQVEGGPPGYPARFLREAGREFPRDHLTNQDLALLESLPQRDPLRSYLGCSLVRVFSLEHDKPMPEYAREAPAEGMYEPGRNYFRRKDGSYFIYDIALGRLNRFHFLHSTTESNRTLRTSMIRIVEAIRSAPTERERDAILDFYLDSILAFPGVGRASLRKLVEQGERDQREYARLDEEHRTLMASPLYRTIASLTGNSGPSRPNPALARSRALVDSVEGYFLFPLFIERLHRELPETHRDPRLETRLAERIREYRASLPAYLAAARRELPPEAARELEQVITAIANDTPLPR